MKRIAERKLAWGFGLALTVLAGNALISYRDLAESESYRWPLSSFVPGVLEKFDLPDCYRALQGKALRQIEPWGANSGPA